jgi:WXG100 family type VII secretion target
MPADKLRVEYEPLSNLANAFAHESQEIEKLIQHLTRCAEELYASGWTGRSANAFYQEASEFIFPATSKLSAVLQSSAEIIAQCQQIYWDADQEVGKLFKKETPAGATTKQAYDPNAGVKEFWSSFVGRFGQMGQSMAQEALTNAMLGPLGGLRQLYGLGKGMVDAYHTEGGGVMGVLGAANELNPVSHLMRTAYEADSELDKAFYLQQVGDHDGAMRHFQQGGEHFADSTVAAVETGMAAAGGAKMGAKFLEKGKAAPTPNDRLFSPEDIDQAFESGNMRSGTPVQFTDAKGALREAQLTPSDKFWHHEGIDVPGAGPGGKDVVIRTHSPNAGAPEGSFSRSHYTTQVDTVQKNPRHVVGVDDKGNLIWKTWKEMTEADKGSMHWPAE